VISAITSFARRRSVSNRCSRADGFDSLPLSTTFAAAPNNCFFQP
jgi:hypothetical protein